MENNETTVLEKMCPNCKQNFSYTEKDIVTWCTYYGESTHTSCPYCDYLITLEVVR